LLNSPGGELAGNKRKETTTTEKERYAIGRKRTSPPSTDGHRKGVVLEIGSVSSAKHGELCLRRGRVRRGELEDAAINISTT